jgi:hypothetical protein
MVGNFLYLSPSLSLVTVINFLMMILSDKTNLFTRYRNYFYNGILHRPMLMIIEQIYRAYWLIRYSYLWIYFKSSINNSINPSLAFLLDTKLQIFLIITFITGKLAFLWVYDFMCHLTNWARHLLAKQLISYVPLYKRRICFRIVRMSGELDSWVWAKNLIDWISIVWSNCWEGWEVLEDICKTVGRILSKKLAVFYFEPCNLLAAFPIT